MGSPVTRQKEKREEGHRRRNIWDSRFMKEQARLVKNNLKKGGQTMTRIKTSLFNEA
jgi:hypothetical protein